MAFFGRMDWFFEKRNKSVASNAQRIVADMHKHLDAQTKKAKEMEEILLKVLLVFLLNPHVICTVVQRAEYDFVRE